jgi:hypothetical protein
MISILMQAQENVRCGISSNRIHFNSCCFQNLVDHLGLPILTIHCSNILVRLNLSGAFRIFFIYCEYLDIDLGLHSASEDEPDKTDIMDYPRKNKPEEPEEESGSGSGSESEVQKKDKATAFQRSVEGSMQPSTKRTGTPNSNFELPSGGSVKPLPKTHTQPPSNTPAPKPEEDDSATGSSFLPLPPSVLILSYLRI